MTFCPECGKSVAPKAKFCRNCGASQLEDALSSVVPEPVAAPVAVPAPSPAPAVPVPPAPVFLVQTPTPPAPPQAVAQPAVQFPCSSCGSPLSPSEKFCGVCGARAGPGAPAAAPATPVSVPVPAPLPMPAPVMGQPSGVRLCTACGNVIQPGDKYCSKCLVIVRDNPPQAAAPAPSPVQSFPAAAPGSYVCASCGSPITGTEKFCVICGTPVVASRVPAPAQQPLVQKT